MKKLLFSTLIAVSLISSAFGAPVKKVNYRISSAFEATFPHVTNVEWDVTAAYAKATFVLNNKNTEAFYNPEGEFIGTSQAINVDELPTAVKRTFAKKYGTYTVKEAIQFEGNEETSYFISAENDKKSIILKVVGSTLSVLKVNEKA